jgi:hypothetical protein
MGEEGERGRRRRREGGIGERGTRRREEGERWRRRKERDEEERRGRRESEEKERDRRRERRKKGRQNVLSILIGGGSGITLFTAPLHYLKSVIECSSLLRRNILGHRYLVIHPFDPVIVGLQ